MNWQNLILKIVPIAFSSVSLVETLRSGATGIEKFQVASAFALGAAKAAGLEINPEVESRIGQTINAAVGLLNEIGVFKHSEREPAPTPGPNPNF